MTAIELNGESLTIDALARIARGAVGAPRLADAARERIRAARAVVEQAVAEGRRVYGVTTGFGSLSDVNIAPDDARALQINLLRSHAAGVGEPLAPDVVRAMLALKLNTFARGTAGVRESLADAVAALLECNVIPVVPSQGSVGASGDLAPLAHLCLPLVGEGEAWIDLERDGSARGAAAVLACARSVPAADALRAAGIAPLALEAIEGLALINGTQAMTAVLALALFDARRLLGAAQIAAALSIDALRGSVVPFREEFRRARPHAGGAAVSVNLTRLLAGSPINASHRDCKKLQDAYSLRTAPAVLGAAIDSIAHAWRVVEREMNSDTGNPLVFAETGEILSGGNFHGAPVAAASDLVAIALTDVASIAERRVNRLVSPQLSELPAFLARDPGLHSGLMIAQYTAAALVSECKTLSHPASVDSIPTSAEKEDHVSMGMTAACKAARVLRNVEHVVAIEILAAAQAIEFLRPLRTTDALEAVHARVRAVSPAVEADRALGSDIEAVAALVREGSIVDAAHAVAGAGALEWPPPL
jgi:histidine ammonia-lyase